MAQTETQVTKEDIKNQIIEQINNCQTAKDLVELLDKMHPSDAHKAIEDFVSKSLTARRLLEDARNNDLETYQTFQDILENSRKSYEHDQLPAKMIDVDMAATKVYTILLRMIGELNGGNDAIVSVLYKMATAINKIEEKNGLELTVFNEFKVDAEESDSNDTTNHCDEQGCEACTDGTGCTCK